MYILQLSYKNQVNKVSKLTWNLFFIHCFQNKKNSVIFCYNYFKCKSCSSQHGKHHQFINSSYLNLTTFLRKTTRSYNLFT